MEVYMVVLASDSAVCNTAAKLKLVILTRLCCRWQWWSYVMRMTCMLDIDLCRSGLGLLRPCALLQSFSLVAHFNGFRLACKSARRFVPASIYLCARSWSRCCSALMLWGGAGQAEARCWWSESTRRSDETSFSFCARNERVDTLSWSPRQRRKYQPTLSDFDQRAIASPWSQSRDRRNLWH